MHAVQFGTLVQTLDIVGRTQCLHREMLEASEYAAAHVPGATLMPMTRLTAHLNELDRTRPGYVVCASGNRSAAMTDLLVASGYDAYSVTGGTTAWVHSGQPLETGAPTSR